LIITVAPTAATTNPPPSTSIVLGDRAGQQIAEWQEAFTENAARSSAVNRNRQRAIAHRTDNRKRAQRNAVIISACSIRIAAAPIGCFFLRRLQDVSPNGPFASSTSVSSARASSTTNR
jgi:hypothetical protein